MFVVPKLLVPPQKVPIEGEKVKNRRHQLLAFFIFSDVEGRLGRRVLSKKKTPAIYANVRRGVSLLK